MNSQNLMCCFLEEARYSAKDRSMHGGGRLHEYATRPKPGLSHAITCCIDSLLIGHNPGLGWTSNSQLSSHPNQGQHNQIRQLCGWFYEQRFVRVLMIQDNTCQVLALRKRLEHFGFKYFQYQTSARDTQAASTWYRQQYLCPASSYRSQICKSS